jgi:hypothetical protein
MGIGLSHADGQMDGRTDMEKLIGDFRNYFADFSKIRCLNLPSVFNSMKFGFSHKEIIQTELFK